MPLARARRAGCRRDKSRGGKALPIAADAGYPYAVRAAVTQTVKTFGRFDILVNNAGFGIGGPSEEIPFETCHRMTAVNVSEALVATQKAARHMKYGGLTIQIDSLMRGYAAVPTASLYMLIKGAVTGFRSASLTVRG